MELKMKLGFLQYSVIWGNPEKNFERIRCFLRNCRCDLLVLPELFSCGYLFEDAGTLLALAEPLAESRTVRFLQTMARQIGGTVTGTFPELENGTLYNTAVAVHAEGVIGIQRKIHLPEYEKRFFHSGSEIVSAELPGRVRIGMMSCFDCWFPQFGALLKEQKCQIFCNSASFGGEVTPGILPVRARENQVFVISCNRTGSEMYAGNPEHFCGKSQIVSPDGKILECAGAEEKLAVVDVDLTETEHPAFGSLICRDFESEHRKYHVTMNRGSSNEFSLD